MVPLNFISQIKISLDMVFLFLEQMHHPNTFILFCRSVPNKQYGNKGCEVSKKGIENYIDFWPKINILQGNYCTLSMDVCSQKVEKSDLQI